MIEETRPNPSMPTTIEPARTRERPTYVGVPAEQSRFEQCTTARLLSMSAAVIRPSPSLPIAIDVIRSQKHGQGVAIVAAEQATSRQWATSIRGLSSARFE